MLTLYERARESPCGRVEVEVRDYVGGTSDYEKLRNKPAVEGNELWKHTKLEDIGLTEVTNAQIDELFK